MSGQKAQDQLRAERLAAELRANLKKRKARSRARNDGSGVKPERGVDAQSSSDGSVPDSD